MGDQVDYNKFTWITDNFSFLESNTIYSDPFVIGGCKWRLIAYPKLDNCLSLFLEVVNYQSLPLGWRRHVRYHLTLVNHIFQKNSIQKEITHWFNQTDPSFGHHSMCLVNELVDKDSGFLVNGKLTIVVEVNFVEVIGKLNVSAEYQEAAQTLKKTKLEDVLVSRDTMDINKLQLLPSQVEFVKLVLKKRLDFAIVLRAQNQHMRNACMYVLLSVMEALCKSLEELSDYDLMGAASSLTYLTNLGFKVDWLENKLEEVKEKKKEAQIGETRMQELKEELKDLKRKCSDKEALLEKEKEKAKVLATRASPLTLHDLV